MNEEPKTKVVPVYKKWWFWVIIGVLVLIGIAGTTGNNNEDSEANRDVAEASDEDKIICANNSVRNDVTGNWKIVTTAEPIDINKQAATYYEKCFKDDGEIHAIVNFSYNTTTKISKAAGLISVTVYEYVDGEEHDAKLLFSGTKLTETFYDAETGEEAKLD